MTPDIPFIPPGALPGAPPGAPQGVARTSAGSGADSADSADSAESVDGVGGAEVALDRTVVLMRDHVGPAASDRALVDALLGVRVLLVADRANLATAAGQSALVTAALLAARSGAQLVFDLPDVPRRGAQPPLTGDRLLGALLETTADLVPGQTALEGLPGGVAADVAVLIGDTPWVPGRHPAALVVRLSGDAWTGAIAPGSTAGARWRDETSPFGALAAGGLAAGEAYKAAMRTLAPAALAPAVFPRFFAPVAAAAVALAPPGTPAPSPLLGAVDFVSGGAITQAALFALARIAGVRATARVIEPDVNDLSNVNRYALLRRSRVGLRKVDDLAAQAAAQTLGGIAVAPVPVRYDDTTAAALAPLAPAVLVGVDHIPTRWAVQRTRPSWLGVGATDHYLAVASFHRRGTACAGCLHPTDAAGGGVLPTLAVVSHWAGLWLAALFARNAAGVPAPLSAQSVFSAMLQPDSPGAVWTAPVPHHEDCPVRCRAVSA